LVMITASSVDATESTRASILVDLYSD
jgi:hypothetical protein